MKWWLAAIAPAIALGIGCGPAPQAAAPVEPAEAADPPGASLPPPLPAAPPPAPDPTRGTVVDRELDFAFDGGRVELELRRDGDRVVQLARNHYAVPIVLGWQLAELQNLEPSGALGELVGVAVLPAAPAPNGDGAPVVLATLAIRDRHQAYRRVVYLHERFGDPRAQPRRYAYRLPYPKGSTFSVLQGFHGAFSHRGSNEYAVDFDCPVATHVLAARPGLVVAANAAAQGAGSTPDFLQYDHTNFVLVLHDDGTLGEYMHLAPSGVLVRPGQHVARGDPLALSGNTGFSSTPHLHFQVMTAADDGQSARSFPFELEVAANVVEAPVQGRAYPSWE